MRAVPCGGWKWGAQQRPEAASSLTEELLTEEHLEEWLGHLVGGSQGTERGAQGRAQLGRPEDWDGGQGGREETTSARWREGPPTHPPLPNSPSLPPWPAAGRVAGSGRDDLQLSWARGGGAWGPCVVVHGCAGPRVEGGHVGLGCAAGHERGVRGGEWVLGVRSFGSQVGLR